MTRFVPSVNLQAELSGVIRPLELKAGDEIAVAATALSHRIMPRYSRREFHVQADISGVRVANTSSGGHLDEFGSRNNPPYAPLRRGVAAAGYRLSE